MGPSYRYRKINVVIQYLYHFFPRDPDKFSIPHKNGLAM